MTLHIVDLPWPPRELHPNDRPHWAVKARKTKAARRDAAWAAKAAGIKPSTAPKAHVTAIFTPPVNRARDLDGMVTNIKPYLDGIADVIGIDDSKWTLGEPRFEPAKAPGFVRLEIREIAS